MVSIVYLERQLAALPKDASIFSRSKLLARIQPETLAQISSIIQQSADNAYQESIRRRYDHTRQTF